MLFLCIFIVMQNKVKNRIIIRGGKVTAVCSYAQHWLEKHGM